MSLVDFLGAVAVVTLGAGLQASVGLGMGLVAVPVLVWIDPAFVPGPLLTDLLFLNVLVARKDKKSIDFKGIGWALVGRVPGVALGALTLTLVAWRAMSVLLGVLVLLAVAMIGSGLRIRRSPGTLLAAGTLSGFMGTTASIGGPPMALLYHDTSGKRVRGTMSGFFLAGVSLSLIALASVGRFGLHEMMLAAALLPGILLGFAFSGHLTPYLDRGYTRIAVLSVSGLAGVSLIVRALF